MARTKPSGSPIRVLLADDHALVRLGFRALLAQLDGVETVADAGDGRETLDLIRTCRPDVALVDISMPGLDGLTVASLVASECPGTRVIILSMHQEAAYVQGAVQAGAAGYVLKNARLAEVETAIRTVYAGQSYFSPGVRGFLGPNPGRPLPPAPPEAPGPGEPAAAADGAPGGPTGPVPPPLGPPADLPASGAPELSPRQHQLVRFIAEGLSTRAIAERLGIAVKTVETHRSLLMARLGAHRVADVVHFAIRYGYIQAGSTSENRSAAPAPVPAPAPATAPTPTPPTLD